MFALGNLVAVLFFVVIMRVGQGWMGRSEVSPDNHLVV